MVAWLAKALILVCQDVDSNPSCMQFFNSFSFLCIFVFFFTDDRIIKRDNSQIISFRPKR